MNLVEKPAKEQRRTRRMKLLNEGKEISWLTNRLAAVLSPRVPSVGGAKLLAALAKWAVIAEAVMNARPSVRAAWREWSAIPDEADKPAGVAEIEERIASVFARGRPK